MGNARVFADNGGALKFVVPEDVFAHNLAAVERDAIGKVEAKPQGADVVAAADEDNKDAIEDVIE